MPPKYSNEQSATPKVDPRNITREDLTDDRRFVELYTVYVTDRGWSNGYLGFLDFASYAEKALQEDKFETPGRLFAALVHKHEKRISLDQEDRARERFPSDRIHTIVARAADPQLQGLDELEPKPAPLTGRNIGFLPSIAMQCFLPQKRLPDGVREWTRSHGNATLVISAGQIVDRENIGLMRTTNVPYGRYARLVLAYVIGQAVKSKSRRIDMGRSLRKFMDRLGISYDGRVGKKIGEAVEDIVAATFSIGRWGDKKVEAAYARMVNEIVLWVGDDDERRIWTQEIRLSREFFDQLGEHQVPIDLDHYAALRSARRMDLYGNLAYETRAIPRRRSIKVSLHELHTRFGQDIAEYSKFKQILQFDLKAIAKVYPFFNVDIQGDMLVLRWSPSPVPGRPLISVK